MSDYADTCPQCAQAYGVGQDQEKEIKMIQEQKSMLLLGLKKIKNELEVLKGYHDKNISTTVNTNVSITRCLTNIKHITSSIEFIQTETSELTEIAERAGAWKTVDGRWVYGEDMVYYKMHDGNQLSMKAKDVSHAVRGKYYSIPFV